MPGYYVHSAACKSSARLNRSFTIGLESPDLLKTYYKKYGLEGARDRYNALKTDDMPGFKVFETRIQQEEKSGSNDGMHYGFSSSPNIMELWGHLEPEEKENPFWRGYVWHLLQDKKIYSRLDVEEKFNRFCKEHANAEESYDEICKRELQKLHNDWNKTNEKIKKTYDDIWLTPDVEELGIVQFIDSDELYYVDWETLKETIDFLREFDPLCKDFEDVIDVIDII